MTEPTGVRELRERLEALEAYFKANEAAKGAASRIGVHGSEPGALEALKDAQARRDAARAALTPAPAQQGGEG